MDELARAAFSLHSNSSCASSTKVEAVIDNLEQFDARFHKRRVPRLVSGIIKTDLYAVKEAQEEGVTVDHNNRQQAHQHGCVSSSEDALKRVAALEHDGTIDRIKQHVAAALQQNQQKGEEEETSSHRRNERIRRTGDANEGGEEEGTTDVLSFETLEIGDDYQQRGGHEQNDDSNSDEGRHPDDILHFNNDEDADEAALTQRLADALRHEQQQEQVEEVQEQEGPAPVSKATAELVAAVKRGDVQRDASIQIVLNLCTCVKEKRQDGLNEQHAEVRRTRQQQQQQQRMLVELVRRGVGVEQAMSCPGDTWRRLLQTLVSFAVLPLAPCCETEDEQKRAQQREKDRCGLLQVLELLGSTFDKSASSQQCAYLFLLLALRVLSVAPIATTANCDNIDSSSSSSSSSSHVNFLLLKMLWKMSHDLTTLHWISLHTNTCSHVLALFLLVSLRHADSMALIDPHCSWLVTWCTNVHVRRCLRREVVNGDDDGLLRLFAGTSKPNQRDEEEDLDYDADPFLPHRSFYEDAFRQLSLQLEREQQVDPTCADFRIGFAKLLQQQSERQQDSSVHLALGGKDDNYLSACHVALQQHQEKKKSALWAPRVYLASKLALLTRVLLPGDEDESNRYDRKHHQVRAAAVVATILHTVVAVQKHHQLSSVGDNSDVSSSAGVALPSLRVFTQLVVRSLRPIFSKRKMNHSAAKGGDENATDALTDVKERALRLVVAELQANVKLLAGDASPTVQDTMEDCHLPLLKLLLLTETQKDSECAASSTQASLLAIALTLGNLASSQQQQQQHTTASNASQRSSLLWRLRLQRLGVDLLVLLLLLQRQDADSGVVCELLTKYCQGCSFPSTQSTTTTEPLEDATQQHERCAALHELLNPTIDVADINATEQVTQRRGQTSSEAQEQEGKEKDEVARLKIIWNDTTSKRNRLITLFASHSAEALRCVEAVIAPHRSAASNTRTSNNTQPHPPDGQSNPAAQRRSSSISSASSSATTPRYQPPSQALSARALFLWIEREIVRGSLLNDCENCDTTRDQSAAATSDSRSSSSSFVLKNSPPLLLELALRHVLECVYHQAACFLFARLKNASTTDENSATSSTTHALYRKHVLQPHERHQQQQHVPHSDAANVLASQSHERHEQHALVSELRSQLLQRYNHSKTTTTSSSSCRQEKNESRDQSNHKSNCQLLSNFGVPLPRELDCILTATKQKEEDDGDDDDESAFEYSPATSVSLEFLMPMLPRGWSRHPSSSSFSVDHDEADDAKERGRCGSVYDVFTHRLRSLVAAHDTILRLGSPNGTR